MLFRIALAFLLMARSALACGPDTDCSLGDRTYRIAMPDGYDTATPVGAIVFAHGYRGSADGVMRNASLRRLASDLGVALIAVKSLGDDWAIPFAPRHMDSDGAAEFAYFDAVLADARARFAIDGTRIMATGFSAGGMMVWNLACRRSGLFAAFAPVAGTFWLRPPDSCEAPVSSIIHIHGDADSTVPLDGRPIQQTRQGRVADALEMYGGFGGFGTGTAARHGDLDCMERSNPAGDLLNFCLFAGGHSFRTEFVGFAWRQFEEAGRL